MMKRFLRVKIKGLGMDTKDFTGMTDAELDTKLEASNDRFKAMLQAMPEETVSLAWRSELNRKVMAKQETQIRKRRFAWFLSPALGLGVAGALAVFVMFKPSGVEPEARPNMDFEAALVASHQDNVQYSDVTGVGLSSYEVVDGKSAASAVPDIGEVDLGSL